MVVIGHQGPSQTLSLSIVQALSELAQEILLVGRILEYVSAFQAATNQIGSTHPEYVNGPSLGI